MIRFFHFFIKIKIRSVDFFLSIGKNRLQKLYGFMKLLTFFGHFFRKFILKKNKWLR